MIDGYTRNRSFYWESVLDTSAKFIHSYNTMGFRDGEFTVEKKAGTKRIMFVGDSFMEGVMAQQDETIPAQFQMLADEKVEVMNFGMLGTGIINYLQLIADVTPVFKPDVVVLAIYANDFSVSDPGFPSSTLEPQLSNPWTPRMVQLIKEWTRGYPVPPHWNGSKPILPKIGEKRFPWPNKEMMLNSAKPKIVDAIVSGKMNPFRIDQLKRENRNLTTTVNLNSSLGFLNYCSQQQGFEPLVVFVPSRNQVTDRYLHYDLECCLSCSSEVSFTGPTFHQGTAVLKNECDQLEIPFLDMTKQIRQKEISGTSLYWNYDEHMRASGYRLIAEQIYQTWFSD